MFKESMTTNWITVALIVLGVAIVIPIVLIGGYIGTSFICEKYSIMQLHKVAPDAYKYDYQCYETENGAYQADFYKFSECDEDFIKDWETDVVDDYVFKTCSISAGIYKPVLIINTTAKCATIEYHCRFWE